MVYNVVAVRWAAPPARAAESRPKGSQEASKNHPKIIQKSTPDPPKIEAKTVKNEVLKEDRIKNEQGGATEEFLEAPGPFFWPSWSRLGPQDGHMLEAKMDPKSIKNRCPKTMKF